MSSMYSLSQTVMPVPCKGSLQAKVATANLRYDRVKRITPSNQDIPAGFCSYSVEQQPRYLPAGWSPHIQPEGQRYFACDSALHVVTEANLYLPEIQDRIEYWTREVNTRLAERKIGLPESAELFLELDEYSDSCFYYLVDHAFRVIFWLEPTTTTMLYLMPSVSLSHLRLALEEQYWSHLEFYPSHRIERLSLRLPELINVFLHAQVDTMTSNVSTFPYNAADCEKFLGILKTIQDEKTVIDGYSVCTLARLWIMVLHNQHQTHHGEEVARLSRDQQILESSTPTRRRWLYAPLRHLLFKIPAYYEDRLEDLFTDRIVYIHQWRDFMGECREEWKQYGSWTLALLLFNALLLIAPGTSTLVAVASMFVCNLAIVSAAALFVKHQRLTTYIASDLATHLKDEQHDVTGFQSYAIQLSLPKALFIWAIVISSTQALFWLQSATNGFVPAALVAAAAAFCVLCRACTLVRSCVASLTSICSRRGEERKDIFLTLA
ncbi:hypothetical protein OBBRIDRAFT_796399 [Obba rivulosa]|uniref:Uncharacterized protein n=1 Tax=Obba rivulosa TaxID=1052685 RepID=A0A8E2DGL1_9APHY|nr:hypothetical protein OBBRIDRAFT_796399 [Obba rivulosa]